MVPASAPALTKARVAVQVASIEDEMMRHRAHGVLAGSTTPELHKVGGPGRSARQDFEKLQPPIRRTSGGSKRGA